MFKNSVIGPIDFFFFGGDWRLDPFVRCRLWKAFQTRKAFQSDQTESGQDSVQSIQIISRNYTDSRPPSFQTIAIPLRFCWMVAIYPPPPHAQQSVVWSQLAWVAHLILGQLDFRHCFKFRTTKFVLIRECAKLLRKFLPSILVIVRFCQVKKFSNKVKQWFILVV